jgi:formylglycine-generating enzyme required for sulfatase activity
LIFVGCGDLHDADDSGDDEVPVAATVPKSPPSQNPGDASINYAPRQGDSDPDAQQIPAENGREPANSGAVKAVYPRVLQGHTAEVMAVCLSTDGRLVFSASTDSTARCWEFASARELARVSRPSGFFSVACTLDGSRLITGGIDGVVCVWSIPAGKQLLELKGHQGQVQGVAYTPHGELVVSGGIDKTVRLWDMSTGKLIHQTGDVGTGITSVAFSPDGRLILAGCGDGSIRVWKTDRGKQLRQITGHTAAVIGIDIADDGRFVASASSDKTVRISRVADGQLVTSFEGHSELVAGTAFSPSGRFVLSGGFDKTLRLWDVETGRSVAVWDAHRRSRYGVRSVALTPDGKFAVSGGYDNSVRIWRLSDHKTGKPSTTQAKPDRKPAAAVKKQMTPAQLALGDPVINSIGMLLVPIPAGEFQMGSPDPDAYDYGAEKPQHLVKITKPFYLSVYEVTQQQYVKVMGVRPWQGKEYVQEGPDYPASYVNWNDAVEFCGKLSEQEGVEYRLPTEAQWEYTCRAGTTTVYSFGDDVSKLGQYAWDQTSAWKIGEKYAHRVGQKLPNPWGLYDMHGNVIEWCQDWYSYYYYRQSPVSNPNGPSSGSSRLSRGGAFGMPPVLARSAVRTNTKPDIRHLYYGLRPARTYNLSP